MKQKITYCRLCFNVTDDDPCRICSDPRRDEHVIYTAHWDHFGIGPAIDIGPLVYSDTWNSYTQTINTLVDGYAGVKPTGGNTGWGFEHSGYIALPTMGGNYTTKPAGAYAAPHWPYKSTKGGVGRSQIP